MFLDVAIEAAQAAGKVILAGLARPVDVQSKGLRNYVTDVDLEAEGAILDVLGRRCPEHDVLTEESPPEMRSSRYRWVIDPIDGTLNYSRGHPCFSVSVALSLDDEPVAGVVYHPLRKQLFAAEAGQGATLEGRPLRVRNTEAMIEAVVGMDWTRDAASRARNAAIIGQLARECNVIRSCGSAALALCYVAAGWWDAYWHLGLQPWDAAAGALIVREAGGQVTDLAGRRWELDMGAILASNGRLHGRLCDEIAMEGGDLV
jgi:myo-inositol-1(or 4)-monophosphatase